MEFSYLTYFREMLYVVSLDHIFHLDFKGRAAQFRKKKSHPDTEAQYDSYNMIMILHWLEI